jgi:hypothetical protein
LQIFRYASHKFPSRLSMTISYATVCNACANDGIYRRIAIEGTTPCDGARRKDTSA